MIKPLNIFLIGPAHPFRGGIAHFCDLLSVNLTLRKHVVKILNFKRLYPKVFFPGKTQTEPAAFGDLAGAVACLDSLNPSSWLATVRLITAARPDVVILQYWEPMLAPIFGILVRLLKREGINTLCVVHNALPHENRPFAKALGRYFLNACDEVVALSKGVGEDLRKSVRLRRAPSLLFLPLYEQFGAPLNQLGARASLGLSPNQPVILFFGHIRKYKGLQLLLESVRMLVPRLPNLRLIVAGEFYDKKEGYISFVRKHSLDGYVQFEDKYIPKSDVAKYFCAADVVVLPYLSATQSAVLSTAYHFERPFIVTDVPGLSEMVPPGFGLVAKPGDASHLSHILFNFFTQGRGSQIRAALQLQKHNYSWNAFCEELETLIIQNKTRKTNAECTTSR